MHNHPRPLCSTLCKTTITCVIIHCNIGSLTTHSFGCNVTCPGFRVSLAIPTPSPTPPPAHLKTRLIYVFSPPGQIGGDAGFGHLSSKLPCSGQTDRQDGHLHFCLLPLLLSPSLYQHVSRKSAHSDH